MGGILKKCLKARCSVSSPKSVIMEDPWHREDKPFNFSVTGYLGIKRNGMLNNHLLQKNRIGVAKKGTHKISPETIFGGNYRDQWTAAHAVTGWAGHLPHIKVDIEKRKKKPITDYLQLNRSALTAAMTVSNDIRFFRNAKAPIRPLYDQTNNIKMDRPPAKTFKPHEVFGRPNIPNANISDLLNHGYQKQWLRQAKNHEIQFKKVIDFKKIRPTRASMLRPHQIPIEIQRLPWRSPAFLNKAQPSISTFRSHKALNDSLVDQSIESSGREGLAGQGIPKNTPHEHFLATLQDPHMCPATSARDTKEK